MARTKGECLQLMVHNVCWCVCVGDVSYLPSPISSLPFLNTTSLHPSSPSKFHARPLGQSKLFLFFFSSSINTLIALLLRDLSSEEVVLLLQGLKFLGFGGAAGSLLGREGEGGMG